MGHKSIRIRRILLSAFLFVGSLFTLVDAIQADPFDQGNLRVSIVIGTGQAYNNDYTIVGLGAGYYVKNGLELGLDGETWLGGDPDINKLSPQAKYILYTQSRFRPYIGVFYTHSFVDSEDDFDTMGGRGGVYILQDERWYIGVGAAYELYIDCDESINNSCTDFYPEITVSFTF